MNGDQRRRIASEILVLVMLTVGIALIYNYTPGKAAWDPAIYLNNAAAFAGHAWLYDEIRPPLYPLLLSVPIRVFGMVFAPLIVMDILLRVACILALYTLLLRWADNRVALPITAIILLSPLVKDVPLFMTEYLSLLLILVTCHAVLGYIDNKRGWLLALAGFTLSLAFLARYTSLFAVLVIGIFLAYQVKNDRRFSHYWPAVVLFVLPIIAWCAWNYAVYGDAGFSIGRAFMHIQHDAVRTSIATRLLLMGATVGPLLVLSLPGVWRSRKHASPLDRLLIVWLFVYLVAVIAVEHFTARYLFFLLPPVAYFVWRGASTPMRWVAAAAVVVLFLLPLQHEDNDVQRIEPQSVELLANATIVGDPSPQVALMTRTTTYGLCERSCEYLRCPICPWSLHVANGCTVPQYLVTVQGRNFSDLDCLGPSQKSGDLEIYPVIIS